MSQLQENTPVVPVGIATKLGVAVGALAAVLGPLASVLNGDQTPETLGALGVAALAFFAVVLGRSHQAAANTQATAAILSAELVSNPAQSAASVAQNFTSTPSYSNMAGGAATYSDTVQRHGASITPLLPEEEAMTPVAAADPEDVRDAIAENAAAPWLDEVIPDDPGSIPADEGSGGPSPVKVTA